MWNFMFAHKNGPAAIIISADSEEEAVAYLTDELGLPASAFRMEREEVEWDKNQGLSSHERGRGPHNLE